MYSKGVKYLQHSLMPVSIGSSLGFLFLFRPLCDGWQPPLNACSLPSCTGLEYPPTPPMGPSGIMGDPCTTIGPPPCNMPPCMDPEKLTPTPWGSIVWGEMVPPSWLPGGWKCVVLNKWNFLDFFRIHAYLICLFHQYCLYIWNFIYIIVTVN